MLPLVYVFCSFIAVSTTMYVAVETDPPLDSDYDADIIAFYEFVHVPSSSIQLFHNFEENLLLTTGDIMFYGSHPKESPVQYHQFNNKHERWFDFTGSIWRNATKKPLINLLTAFDAVIILKCIYVSDKVEDADLTFYGSGFYIDQYHLMSARHTFMPCRCIMRLGNVGKERQCDRNGGCDSFELEEGWTASKYTRKRITTEENGDATIYDISNDDVLVLQTDIPSKFVVPLYGLDHLNMDKNAMFNVILVGCSNFAFIRDLQTYDVIDGHVIGAQIKRFFNVAAKDRSMILEDIKKFISIGNATIVEEFNGYTLQHNAPSWYGNSGGLIILAGKEFIVVGIHLGGNEQDENRAYTTFHPFLAKYTQKHLPQKYR